MINAADPSPAQILIASAGMGAAATVALFVAALLAALLACLAETAGPRGYRFADELRLRCGRTLQTTLNMVGAVAILAVLAIPAAVIA